MNGVVLLDSYDPLVSSTLLRIMMLRIGGRPHRLVRLLCLVLFLQPKRGVVTLSAKAVAEEEINHYHPEIFSQYYNSIGPFSQAEKFFELPFDESDYFRDFNSCGTKEMILSKCQLGVNSWYRAKNLFIPQWSRQNLRDDYNRAKVDCLYNVSKLSMISRKRGTSFLFSLRQCCCNSTDFPYRGGSSFEVSAVIDDNYLVACSMNDNFDGQYTLSCVAPTTTFALKMNDEGVNVVMTVVLLYEHYDTYSEIHEPPNYRSSPYAPPNLYPPTRFVILDSESFYFSGATTFDESSRDGPSETNASKHYKVDGSGFPMNNSATIYTGFWRRGPSALSLFSLHWDHLMSMRRYREDVGVPTNYTALYGYNKAARLPKTTTGIAGFDFQRFDIVTARKGSMISPFDNYSQFYDLPFKNLTADSTHAYYFYGASHMRYYYDTLLELYIGRESLQNFGRKHENGEVKNFFLHGNALMHQLVSQLDETCSKLASNDSISYEKGSRHATLVMQSGAWDLTNHGIRSVLHQPDNAPLLVNKLRDILSGMTPCPGLSHVVWVMTPTHPVCFNDFERNGCSPSRGHRMNPAIAAVNAYLMRSLLNMTIADGIKLSIVDVFSVTRPRVLFNEDYEVIFKNHYIVRGETNDGMRVVYTPAGLAAVQLLVAALSA